MSGLPEGYCKHCKEQLASLFLIAAINDAGGRGTRATYCYASESHEHEFTFPDTTITQGVQMKTAKAKTSKQAQHTPGPFLSIGAQYPGRAYRVQKGGPDPCDCYIWDDDTGPGGKGEGVQFFMCQIHLAAPEMLEAMKRVSDSFSDWGDSGDKRTYDLRLLRDAIAKAERKHETR